MSADRALLPVRPRPRPPESIETYLDRVAEANGVPVRAVGLGRTITAPQRIWGGLAAIAKSLDLSCTELLDLTVAGRYPAVGCGKADFRTPQLARSLSCSACGRSGDLESWLTLTACCVLCGGLLTGNASTSASFRDEQVSAAQAQLLQECRRTDPVLLLPHLLLRDVVWAVSTRWPSPRDGVPDWAEGRPMFPRGDRDLSTCPPADVARILPFLGKCFSLPRAAAAGAMRLVEMRVRTLFWPFYPREAPNTLRDIRPATWAEVVRHAARLGLASKHIPLGMSINPPYYVVSRRLGLSRVALSRVVAEAVLESRGWVASRTALAQVFNWRPTSSSRADRRMEEVGGYLRGDPHGRGLLMVAMDALASAGLDDYARARRDLRQVRIPHTLLRQIRGISVNDHTMKTAESWAWVVGTAGAPVAGPAPHQGFALADFDEALNPEGRLLLAEYVQELLHPCVSLDLPARVDRSRLESPRDDVG